MIEIGKLIACSAKMKSLSKHIAMQDIMIYFAQKINGTNAKPLSEISDALCTSITFG